MKDYNFEITYMEDCGEIYGMLTDCSAEKCSKYIARRIIKRLLGDRKFVISQGWGGVWEYHTVKNKGK